MPNRSVRRQALMVIVLVLVSVFSTMYTERFLENQEKIQIEFNQKRLAQKALEAIMPTVEAQSRQDITKLSKYIFGNGYISVFCHNGNLIYLTSQGGIWGVPDSMCLPPPPKFR